MKPLRTESIEEGRRDNRIYTVLSGWNEEGNQGRKKLGAGKANVTVLSAGESVPEQDHRAPTVSITAIGSHY